MKKCITKEHFIHILMRVSFPILLLMMAAGISFASHSSAQELLRTKISYEAHNESLKAVLTYLEKSSGVRFTYTASLVRNKMVSISAVEKPLGQLLHELLNPLRIGYSVSGDFIILQRLPAGKAASGLDLFPGMPQIPENIQPLDRTVTGIVRDEKGEGLPGVNILVKGTQQGMITDSEGRFFLLVPDSEAILVFSFVGYLTEEIAVGSRSQLEVALKVDQKKLDEVVVVGYGTTRRSDFTGSVGSLNLEESPVALAPNLNALEALKGSITGLNIGPVNAAGMEPAMVIRGQNSINGSNTPLIVLDGVIYMGSLSSINPRDIASIDVLKDATSAAAYGSRSANGVIAITTKKGRKGKPVIQLNSSIGFQEWQRKPQVLDGDDWIKMVNDRNKYEAGSTNWMRPGERANREAGRETKWLDVISRTGVMQNYQASVSGATDNLNYYVSGTYDQNKSIIKGDQFSRVGVMAKLKADITSWLEVGLNGGYARRDYSGGPASISAAFMMSPYGVMYRDDKGNLEKYPYTESAINPLWGVDDGTRDREEYHDEYRLNSHALIRFPFLKGLSYQLNYQLNENRSFYGNFFHESYYVQEGDSPQRYDPATIQGFLSSANGTIDNIRTHSYVLDNILSYKNTFGNSSLEVTLVATRDFLSNTQQNMTGSNFAENGNTALGINGLHKATVQRIQLNAYDRANVGYLARVSYTLNHKYFFTGSYRRDGASVFGVDNKWANFWAAGVAWKVTGEEFMQPVRFLDDLKVKFSWGQNGNQGIGPYTTLSTVQNASAGGVRYQFSNSPGRIFYGLVQTTLGNSYLGWETTSSWNAGFESVWFNQRLHLDADVYFSKTTDQIFTRNIPVMIGFNSIVTSMGQVNNAGFEIALKTMNVKNADFQWSTGATFWRNYNKLVSLYGEDLDGDGKEDDDLANNLFVGKSLGAIYGYEQIGIVQEQDTEYMSATGAVPGHPKYRDLDGQPGITANDRKILGYTKPKYTLSFNNTLSYKSLSLYFMVMGIFGGKDMYLLANQQAYMTNGTGRPYDNTHYIPYWTAENRSDTHPSATFAGDGRFLGLQSRSFVRVQDISLFYTLDSGISQKLGAGQVRLFATAKNPAVFTKWVGGDPEVGGRMRENTMPVASTYSLGINVSF